MASQKNKTVREKHEYTEEQLNEILDKVRNNTLNPYAAQRLFKIPRMTIVNRLNKTKSSVRGRPTTFTHD